MAASAYDPWSRPEKTEGEEGKDMMSESTRARAPTAVSSLEGRSFQSATRVPRITPRESVHTALLVNTPPIAKKKAPKRKIIHEAETRFNIASSELDKREVASDFCSSSVIICIPFVQFTHSSTYFYLPVVYSKIVHKERKCMESFSLIFLDIPFSVWTKIVFSYTVNTRTFPINFFALKKRGAFS